MSATEPKKLTYGLSKTLAVPFDDALASTREALKDEGFGIISEIDLKDKLKEKLGVDFRRYTILGACNPPLAYQTLQEDLAIGLLLPCNVIVYEADAADKSVVAVIDARAMFSVVGENPTLDAVSKEVQLRLRSVLDKL
jgi:uncharacterized protein (DUF302 family)